MKKFKPGDIVEYDYKEWTSETRIILEVLDLPVKREDSFAGRVIESNQYNDGVEDTCWGLQYFKLKEEGISHIDDNIEKLINNCDKLINKLQNGTV